MCTVSMVGDHYRDIWKDRPWYPQPAVPMPSTAPIIIGPEITRAEFDDLKRQVAEMKELLKRAKRYDEENGQADCEVDDKMELLRKIAKAVGVDLGDVIPEKKPDWRNPVDK